MHFRASRIDMFSFKKTIPTLVNGLKNRPEDTRFESRDNPLYESMYNSMSLCGIDSNLYRCFGIDIVA